MLINLAKKDLPWMKIDKKKSKKEKVFLACRMKKRIKIEKLCEGLPEEFLDYLKYCRKLEFEQEPNYNYLRNLFSLILTKKKQRNDLNFFWINKKKAESVTKNNENNHIMKRDTHKRLYSSVKKSLEKKRKEESINSINKTLKSDYSKINDSLDKEKDIQNNKKGIQKRNFLYRNLNIKSVNDKTKILIKNYNTANNINIKAIATSRIDEQKYNNSLQNLNFNQLTSKNDLYLNSKKQLVKIKPQKKIPYNIGLKNNISFPNKNIKNTMTMNITIKNYYDLKDRNINNYQNRKAIINNYYNNNYYNKIIKQIPSKNNYILKNNILRTSDNNSRFGIYSGYSFQNDNKNIRTLDNKNRFENNNAYSFQKEKKNISFK